MGRTGVVEAPFGEKIDTIRVNHAIGSLALSPDVLLTGEMHLQVELAPDPLGRVSPPNAPETFAEASARLLRSAEGTLRADPAVAAPRAFSEFVQIYREWITLERGELGTQQEQTLQWQMLVHCMVTAATIEEAMQQFLYFAPVVWGDRAPSALRIEGDQAALVFHDPFRPGPEGLIAAIWMLTLMLSTVEFLAQATFRGASGRVIHSPILPEGVARLLFHAPITYDCEDAALLLPRADLRRPVTVRASDLPSFFRQVLPLTLGAASAAPQIRTMVAGLIRDHKQGPEWHDISRSRVAGMLGVSEATMRRRLAEEGTTFRALRDAVYDELAIGWIERGDISIAEIAARLGFSDAFAFRRFFARLHGCSPSAFRQGERPGIAAGPLNGACGGG